MKPTLRGRIESSITYLATTSEQIGKFKAKEEAAGKPAPGQLIENLQKARDELYRQIKVDLILLGLGIK